MARGDLRSPLCWPALRTPLRLHAALPRKSAGLPAPQRHPPPARHPARFPTDTPLCPRRASATRSWGSSTLESDWGSTPVPLGRTPTWRPRAAFLLAPDTPLLLSPRVLVFLSGPISPPAAHLTCLPPPLALSRAVTDWAEAVGRRCVQPSRSPFPPHPRAAGPGGSSSVIAWPRLGTEGCAPRPATR